MAGVEIRWPVIDGVNDRSHHACFGQVARYFSDFYAAVRILLNRTPREMDFSASSPESIGIRVGLWGATERSAPDKSGLGKLSPDRIALEFITHAHTDNRWVDFDISRAGGAIGGSGFDIHIAHIRSQKPFLIQVVIYTHLSRQAE